MKPRRRELLGVLAAASLTGLAGCNGSDGGDDPAATSPTITPTARLTTTADGDEPAGTTATHSPEGPKDTSVPTPSTTTSRRTRTDTTERTSGTTDPTTSTSQASRESPQPSRATKIAAAGGDEGDEFGFAIDLSGDGTTALLGAPGDEDPNGPAAGSAYVFEQRDGAWTQTARLAAPNGDKGDQFGSAVALSADSTTALIGASGDEDPNGDGAGSAAVFERDGSDWTQTTKLVADGGGENDLFGDAVELAADGRTALVGAWQDDRDQQNAGSAYVFEREGGTWRQASKLTADDADGDDLFGKSVGLSGKGNVALVGAPFDEDSNGTYAGSVYVFERTDGRWTQATKFAPNEGDQLDFFGLTLAVTTTGEAAIVGAPGVENPNGPNVGSAYVLSRADGSWVLEDKLAAPDGDRGDFFGQSASISGDGSVAVVGAPKDEDPNGDGAGSASVFERDADGWATSAELAPDDGDAADGFGNPVTIGRDGRTVLVGASGDEDPNGDGAGAGYVFDL